MSEENVTLKVLEAYTRDVGRGVARIDYEAMDILDASTGDIIEIKGKRTTVAKCLPLYPSDEGREVIRIDGLIRNNAGMAISDTVTIRKIKAPPAEKVVVEPEDAIPPIDERYLADALESVPVTEGDSIMIPYFGGRLTFRVRGISTSGTSSAPDAVLITQRTLFEIAEKGETITKVPQINYEDIGGLRSEIVKVREMIELPLRHPEIFEKLGVEAPKGILLYGPPGTGKTLLAKAVAKESDAHFMSISGPEIMSKFYGESEARLREVFKDGKEKSPSIIFIDEIDSIAPKREEVTGEVERRVVSQLLSLMDGLEGRGKVIVIAATNRPNAIDPALRRPGRFDREIEIKVPDKIGREEILRIHIRGMPLCTMHDGEPNCGCDIDTTIREELVQEISTLTHGFVGADLEGLCKEAAMKTINRTLPNIQLGQEKLTNEEIKEIRILKEDFQKAMKEVTPSAMREVFIEIPNVQWNDIGGLTRVKEELKQSVEYPLKFRELSERGIKTIFEKLGKTLPKGILLYGPPGTGKTLLAKAAATSSDANFISVKGPEIVSKWVGESERGIREIFRRARQASPCIIFLDEMDSIAGSRQLETTGNHDQKLVSQLLTELDGIQELEDVIVIGATNRIDMIDPAIMRGGRFDKIINVGIPDKDAIKEIIKIHTDVLPKQTRKLINKKENMARIIQLTDGFTGADIASVTSKLVTMILEKHQKEMKDIETWKKKENILLKKYRNEKRKWTSEKYPELNYNFDLYPEPLRSKRINKISKKAEQDDTGTEWNNKEEEVRQAIRKMLEKDTDTNWLSNKYDDRKQFNKLKFNKDGKVIITLDTINVNELTVKENMEKETDTETVRNEEIQLTKLKDDLQKEVNERVEKIYNDFGQELFDQLNDLVEEKMLRYRLKIEEIETAIVSIREIKEGKPRELSIPRQVVKKTGFYG